MWKRFGSALALIAGMTFAYSGASAQDKVRLAYATQIHQANMMLIQDYAKRNGVDLEVTILSHYTNLQIALTTNQMDFVVMGYVNMGLMEEKGFNNYKVISGVFTGGQSLTLRNGVTVKTWKDLEGKKIGDAPNSYADILFKTSAKLGGADLSKIHMVNFPPGPAVTAALASGDIDGFVFWEPINANAAVQKIGTYSTLDLGDNPTKHINGALYVNKEYAEKHKDIVVGVVKALAQSTDALNADPKLFFDTVLKGTRSAPEEVKEALPRGKLDYKLYQKEAVSLLRLINEAGITKVDTSPAVAKMFDYSYLMAATGKSRRDLGGE